MAEQLNTSGLQEESLDAWRGHAVARLELAASGATMRH